MHAEREGFGFATGDAVVVTGAGSGIGRGTALAAAAAGLNLSLWDIAAGNVKAVADEALALGAEVHIAEADVSDEAAVDAALAGAKQALGPLRYLVNNAGPRAADPYTFTEGLRLGAGSMALVTERWLAAGPPTPAAVVSVASVAGNVVGADPVWYAATKAAVGGFTRAMALKLGPDIRINAVAPSLVNTPRMGKWTESDQGRNWADTNPLKRWAVADDIAWPIVFLLSPRASYINGVVLPIDGGQTLIL